MTLPITLVSASSVSSVPAPFVTVTLPPTNEWPGTSCLMTVRESPAPLRTTTDVVTVMLARTVESVPAPLVTATLRTNG